MLCICSTIGGCAEETAMPDDSTVIRIDRPMAEKAVSIGSRIVIAATLHSTMGPTKALVLDAALKAYQQ